MQFVINNLNQSAQGIDMREMYIILGIPASVVAVSGNGC